MQINTLTFSDGRWSKPLDGALDSAATLVICFAAPRFVDDPAPLAALRRAMPAARMIGCSTSGEIDGARVCDDSIVAAIVRFEHTRVEVATARVMPGASRSAGAEIAERLVAPDLRALLVLSDGLAVNGTELVDGLNAVVGSDVIVTGGLAGDGSRFQATWVLDDEGRPRSGLVSAVALYGDRVDVRHGSKGGWDVFGPERSVTRSKGNVLFELDGKPALELYKSYLGDRARGLPATALLFPLALRRDEHGPPVVRTILAVDEATQSLTFAGDIEQGGTAQLMRANFDRLVQGASDAALMCSADAHDVSQSVLSIAISCVGRRLVLGQRTEEETEATFDVLPKGSVQVGYYSYGEISPYVVGGRCDLHNQTMTLTTLAER